MGVNKPMSPRSDATIDGHHTAMIERCHGPRRRLFCPAALVLVWSAGCGTFAGSASAVWTIAGHLTLIAVVATAGDAWRNPLALGSGPLGRLGNVLLATFFLVTILSWLRSPVPRAGQVALVVAPAFLLVPRWTASFWRDDDKRRIGLLAFSTVTALIALWSLVGVVWLETPGASLPLGHHNLLASWLVLTLPLAFLPWRDGGAARWLAGMAVVLGLVALVLTRSLGGFLGLGVVLLLAIWQWRRLWAVVAMVVATCLAGTRLIDLGFGTDSSFLARAGYMQAGWNGFLASPLLGWGPGSSRWTLGRFLEPRPGIHPADQVVADPHSWPVTVAFELGVLGFGLAIAVGVVFVVSRWKEKVEDVHLRRAAAIGLVGFVVTTLTGRPQTAPALFIAGLVVLGALLSQTPHPSASQTPHPSASQTPHPPPSPREDGRGGREAGRGARSGRSFLLALLLAVVLLPFDRAHLAYDRAVAADDPAIQRAMLAEAERLDPRFPLYRLRRALIDKSEENADNALVAARGASGLAPFWLAAGVLGQTASASWSEDALLESCRLNPLGALAPWRLFRGSLSKRTPNDERAVGWAGRALLAEPLLLAAEGWNGHEALRRQTVKTLEPYEQVDALWRVEMLERDAALVAAALEEMAPGNGSTRKLVLEMDQEGGTSLSLHAFRRRPWPLYIDTVVLVSERLELADLIAATALDSTDPALFADSGCSLPL